LKTSMNMLLWTPDMGPEHFPLLADLRAADFDGVEFTLNPARDAAHRRALVDELDRLGFERTCINAPLPEQNPVSPDRAVRARAIEHLRWCVNTAAEMGCRVLGGPLHSAYGVKTGAPPTDDEKGWCADAMRAAAEEAERADVVIACEYLNRFESYLLSNAADALDLVRRVEHPRFRMLWDTHHAHIEEKDIARSIGACGAQIAHVHVSENDRGTPGSGQVAWRATFDALKAAGYDGWLVIEAFSRSDVAFANAIGVWREFDPPRDVYEQGLAFMRESW
jgi:D-psicose/D-tagatose/L-ribulose 3-epimerase